MHTGHLETSQAHGAVGSTVPRSLSSLAQLSFHNAELWCVQCTQRWEPQHHCGLPVQPARPHLTGV